MTETSFADRVLQKSSEPSHYHNIRHNEVHPGEENTITSVEALLAIKTLKAAGCNEIRTEILKASNRKVFVANLSVSSGIAFWKHNERLTNWGIIPYTKRGQKVLQKLPRHFSP